MTRSIFSGMQILSEGKWVTQHAVVVEKNIIKAIISEEMISHHFPAKHHHFPHDYYLIPGLIDLHVHGAHGKDVMDANQESLAVISRGLAEEGVTGFLATTMTMDNARIEAALSCISDSHTKMPGAKILGVHLEGPFIAKEKIGAQAGDFVQHPNHELMSKWQKISGDTIRLVTLAPELPGAIPLIKMLHRNNIIPAIGHTNATYEETQAAILAGGRYATHLFNAMSGLHQRKAGAVAALLLSNEVSAELIVDGFHLHPAMTELAFRLKSKNYLILVSDAMRAKCMGDGKYELGGQTVRVHADKVTLEDGTLAGSTLVLSQAIKNMSLFSQCSLIDAIQMATHNPAAMLGLSTHKGSIAVGWDADITVLDANLSAVFTMCEGKEIFSK